VNKSLGGLSLLQNCEVVSPTVLLNPYDPANGSDDLLHLIQEQEFESVVELSFESDAKGDQSPWPALSIGTFADV
jgi:hypothetical protein